MNEESQFPKLGAQGITPTDGIPPKVAQEAIERFNKEFPPVKEGGVQETSSGLKYQMVSVPDEDLLQPVTAKVIRKANNVPKELTYCYRNHSNVYGGTTKFLFRNKPLDCPFCESLKKMWVEFK